jgi:uncharacterized membrane protein YfhO
MITDIISIEDLFYFGYIIPIFIMLLWLMWERSRLKDKYVSRLYKDALVLLIPGAALFGVIVLALNLFLYYMEKFDKKFHITEDK